MKKIFLKICIILAAIFVATLWLSGTATAFIAISMLPAAGWIFSRDRNVVNDSSS